MPFIQLTINVDTPVSINTDNILFVEPNGSRAKVNFNNGGHLSVRESYEAVKEQLPSYGVLEGTDGELLQEQPLTEEQEALIRETLKHQAKLDAEKATEEARKDKGNPAKDRETKSLAIS